VELYSPGLKRSLQHLIRIGVLEMVRRPSGPGRAKLGSVGAPVIRRDVRRRFWRLTGHGIGRADAASLVGVSLTIADRWFAQSGGMPPLNLDEPSGRFLSLFEREEIAIWWVQGVSMREIARRLGRSPSTISRELRRNASTRGQKWAYRATTAQFHAERRLPRPKIAKLAEHEQLREYVQDKLTGSGRWSPEQIARRLVLEFPDDESMRVSHEAIYQALYIQGRGALRRELTACLRTRRAIRKPRRGRENRGGKRIIPPEIMISERPPEIEDRAVPGHWEGDLVIGANSSAVATLVERKTRFLMLVPLPRLADVSQGEKGWTGRGAETVRDALAAAVQTLPAELRRSLTWDQGAEMGRHAELKIAADIDIYFCDPHSPWQRGSNENTNGLLRQYLPRGTNMWAVTHDELTEIAAGLNGRPRKTLNWKTPAEAFNEELLSPAS
jgi:IS30 family transposase